jgi:serine O-acetyltransferase
LSAEPITWSETRRRTRADRERLLALQRAGDCHLSAGAGRRSALLCVRLYRMANHHHRRRRNVLARFFWQLNVLLTGADISPCSDLGDGLVITSPAGVSIAGKAGRNLTVMPLAGMGSEIGRREDIGPGPGLPLLGDDVVLGALSGVLGPVRIGDRVQVEPGAAVLLDVPDDTRVEGPRMRVLPRQEPAGARPL